MKQDKKTEKDYRTYQIVVKRGHRLYSYLDELCKNGNNLYNTTNFYIRQVFTGLNQKKRLELLQQEVLQTLHQNLHQMNENQHKAYLKKLEKEKQKPKEKQKEIKEVLFEFPTKEKSFLGYLFLDCLFKTIKQKDYYSLPGQINQQVIRNVVQNWKSFFQSLKEYHSSPQKFKARPQIPGYLPKGGKKEMILSNQVCKIKESKTLRFPKTKHTLNIGKVGEKKGSFQQVRIIPQFDTFVVEVVFLIGEQKEITSEKERLMGIDLGIDNLAAIVFNTGTLPILFKGGKVKSINQWYNKLRAYYYSILRNGHRPIEGKYRSKKLSQIDVQRQRQIKDFFHKVSFRVVQIAKENEIDSIIIGKSMDWKQETELGKRNNQNFVQIPHSVLIKYITYKAHAEGIQVIVNEESYTSQASFLDYDDIPTYQSGNVEAYTFSGKRISRGLYRSKNNILFNADLNGAANIVRKVVPTAFANGIAAVCFQPQVVNVQ